MTIFENRYYLMFGQETIWKKFRIPVLASNYILAFLYGLPSFLMFPEQSSALARVLETLPPLPDSILSHQIIVYATELRYFIIPIMLMVSLLGIETLIIAYLIVSKMNSREHTFRMSQKTMAMQKKILMALLIQASTMTINFLIPITYICSTIIFNYHNQAANNICFLVFSLHGLTSTSIMLWSHKPYRAVCSSFLGFRKSEVNSSKGIQVVATIMLNRSHVGRTSFLAS
uniref:Serpentine Receptor, class H n=2 Tax=Caenorhabditis tropicalis TaxID=1561998 RepID=A0A1I7V1J5_9PELO